MALDKYKVLTPLNRRFLATKKQRYTAMTLAVVLSVAVGQIIFNSFASNTALSSIPEVAKMQELTIKVTAMADEYAKMPDTIAGKKSTQQPNAAKAQKKQDLIALVNQRKDAYKVAMMYDPQVTADNYLPYDTRDKLPTDIQPSLEQINVISGTWMSAIVSQEPKAGDTTQTKQESHTISIVDANNNSISVYGNNLPNIDSGTPITVLGISVENSMTMALPSAIDQPAPTSSSVTFLQKINDIQPVHAATSIASRVCKSPSIRDFVKKYYLGGIFDDSSEDVCVTRLSNVREKVFCSDQKECTSAWDTPIDLTGDAGKRKTLVVPIQFASDTDLPITRDGLAGVYQRVTDSYNRMSYGKFAPHYDVWGNWQLTAASNSFPTCDDKNLSERQTAFSTIARNTVAANSELDNAIKTGGYTDVMYVLSDMICGGQSVGLWGWANVGYNRGDNYVAESFMSLGNDRNDVQTRFPAVMIHELGHTYGLNHARGACSEGAPSDPTQIDQSLFCLPADAEYANHYDPMGDVSDPDPTDFSFADKLRLNWVSKDDYYDVTRNSGQYTINALSKPSGKRSLKLSYQGRDLYIDYRANDVSGAKGTSSRGLLVYYANSDHSTSLLGSNRSRISTTSPWTWNYFTAGQMGPFRIGVGDDAICVSPVGRPNFTEDSIDVRVDRGECPKDEITNYVYEKTINYPPGMTMYASDLKLDKDGNFYIGERANKKIYKLDKDGNLLKTFTVPTNYITNSPKFSIDEKGNIYLAVMQQLGQHEYKQLVLKYDFDGKELARWDPGDLRSVVYGISYDQVNSIETNSKGDVFIIYKRKVSPAWSDYTQSIVMKLNNQLEEQKRWNLPDKYTGTGLGFDKNDDLHIFESGRMYGVSGYIDQPENCMHEFSSNGDDKDRWCKPNPKGEDYYSTSNDVFSMFNFVEVDRNGNYLLEPGDSGGNTSMYYANHQYVGRIGTGVTNVAYEAMDLGSDGKLYMTIRSPEKMGINVYNPDIKPIVYKSLRN